jgi:hypothetical protein
VLIYSSGTTEQPSDPLERYGKLLFELSDILDSVRCDRRLVMYRAHQHGMELAEIARRSHAELSEVQGAIDTLSVEPEADDWEIATWVPRYLGD